MLTDGAANNGINTPEPVKRAEEQPHSPSSPERPATSGRQRGKEERLQGEKIWNSKKRRGTEEQHSHRARSPRPAGRHDATATPAAQRAETWRRAGSWRYQRARPGSSSDSSPFNLSTGSATLSRISGRREIRSVNTTCLADNAYLSILLILPSRTVSSLMQPEHLIPFFFFCQSPCSRIKLHESKDFYLLFLLLYPQKV